MKSLKALFSDTLIYGVSTVIARFLNYLLVPFYTGMFDPDAYGVVGLVYAGIALFNVLFTLGMESSYIRYGKDREQADSHYTTIQLFLTATSLVLMLLLWLAKPWIAGLMALEGSLQLIYWYMLGILFFDTISIVPFAELRLRQRAWMFAALKTVNVIINLGLNFYLILVQEMGIEAVFISNLVASVVTMILVSVATIGRWKGSWNRELLPDLLAFGLPFVPAGIGFAINEGIDRFFLGAMSDSAVYEIYGLDENAAYIVGIYNACYKLAVFMLLVVQMYRMAWQPFFMRISEDPDAPETFARAFRYFNLAAAGVFLVVSLFVEQIVAIRIPLLDTTLIGEEYWLGLSIVPFLLAAYWLQGWYVNFSAGIFLAERTKRLAQITLTGAAVTLISNFILVPILGMTGSAIATLASYLIMAMMIYRYSVGSYAVPYQLGRGFTVIGISGLAVFSKAFFSEYIQSDLLLSSSLLIFSAVVISMVSLSGSSGEKAESNS